MNFILNPWPWYVAGPLIALVMLLLILIGKSFGISSNLRTICSMAGAGKFAEFFRYDWRKSTWNLIFVLGTIIGGYLAGTYLTPDQSIDTNPKTVASLESLGILES